MSRGLKREREMEEEEERRGEQRLLAMVMNVFARGFKSPRTWLYRPQWVRAKGGVMS